MTVLHGPVIESGRRRGYRVTGGAERSSCIAPHCTTGPPYRAAHVAIVRAGVRQRLSMICVVTLATVGAVRSGNCRLVRSRRLPIV
jgi:hypothetical protein